MNDPVGNHYVDKIVGKCPHCNDGLRAYGDWESGIQLMCINFKCQVTWESD